MRPPPNKFLRLVVPLAFVLGGVGILFAVLNNTKSALKPATTPASNTATQEADGQKAEKPAAPVAAADPKTPPAPDAEAEPNTTPPPTETPTAAAAPAAKYAARKVPLPGSGYTTLGSVTPKKDGGKYEMELRFSDFGAGLERLTLANHTEEVLKPDPHVLQSAQAKAGDGTKRVRLTAFSAQHVQVNGVNVDLGVVLREPGMTYWHEVSPGEFEATIEDEAHEPVLRITRKFELPTNSYEFELKQTVANIGKQPVTAVFHEIGPIDQPQGVIRYGGDPRHIRFGYMDDPADDPARIVVSPANSTGMLVRSKAIGARTLWPTSETTREKYMLVWAATTSRYFTVAAFNPPPKPGAAPTTDAEKVLPVATVEDVVIPVDPPLGGAPAGPSVALGLGFVSNALTISPGASADLSRQVYAGPTSRKFIAQATEASKLGLAEVVVYTFGGPCAFCTFQSITYLLRSFLSILHDHVLFDWALAIILLVVCVRTLLHPVTRWSQTNMLRFSKNLQRLAPKQKAIQEKYKDDPLKMREEIARLMREEGVGIGAGAMGCLPAFLQTPVWVALSATLYFAFELRHEPAFFGIFQRLTGGKWAFLADLAEPDHFIRLGSSYHVPLLSSLMGPIDGLNVMPILLGIVFFIQQKYLTPPQAATLTPEQEQQQKIMKVMTVVLFPLMMYNAPSGLAFYFFVNSSLAIVESRHIRKKAEKIIDAEQARKAAGVGTRAGVSRNGTAENRKPGLFERLQKLAEERQKMMDEARKMQSRKEKGKR